jgi:hypothetical protein
MPILRHTCAQEALTFTSLYFPLCVHMYTPEHIQFIWRPYQRMHVLFSIHVNMDMYSHVYVPCDYDAWYVHLNLYKDNIPLLFSHMYPVSHTHIRCYLYIHAHYIKYCILKLRRYLCDALICRCIYPESKWTQNALMHIHTYIWSNKLLWLYMGSGA